MPEGAEIRAFVVVLLVVAAIGGAFAAISRMDVDDEVIAAPPSTTTTSTTTTQAPLTPEQRLGLLCARAEQFVADIEPFVTEPILVMRAGEGFYADVVELAPPEVAAEYDAALDHYVDFNDIGDPLGYDTEEILREGDGLRWEALVTRDPFAVNVTRDHVGFICGVELPPPYKEDAIAFAAVKEKVDRELNPDRYATTATQAPITTAVAPATATVPGEDPDEG
jgi:hypothetical protein